MTNATNSRTDITNRFIANLLCSAKAEELIRIGKAAQAIKDDDLLSAVGARLCVLSRRTYAVGLYFLALTLNRSNAADRARARLMFEQLADEGSPVALSASLALGTTYGAVGEFDKADALYAHILRSTNDPAILFHVYHNRAFIFGQDGHHNRALTALEAALKLSKPIPPVYRLHALNNAACELLEIGRVEDAKRVFQPVQIAAGLHREFEDTALSIRRASEARERQDSRVVISLDAYRDLDERRLKVAGQLSNNEFSRLKTVEIVRAAEAAQ